MTVNGKVTYTDQLTPGKWNVQFMIEFSNDNMVTNSMQVNTEDEAFQFAEAISKRFNVPIERFVK